MLSHVTKYVSLIFLAFFMACNQREKENKERNQKILERSKSIMGGREYNNIYQQALDSLSIWCLAQLPRYRSVWSFNYRLDSILCFNSGKDRVVMAILVQCNKPDCQTDDVMYFYGAKIKGQWYFFRGGGAMGVLRENYQSDISVPVSFEKLHELAMNNMLRGYMIKNKDGIWVINDAFFTSHFEGVNWGDFNKQTHEDTVAYGKRFINKREYFESIYLDVAKGIWLNTNKKDEKPLE